MLALRVPGMGGIWLLIVRGRGARIRLWMFGLDVVGGNRHQRALVGTYGMKDGGTWGAHLDPSRLTGDESSRSGGEARLLGQKNKLSTIRGPVFDLR
jgi:hypothetical protein